MDMTKIDRQIISWNPMVLKIRIKGLPIDCAHELFNSIRPENYHQEIMMRYDHQKLMGWITIGTAYGEINLNQWSTVDQMKLIKRLEKAGWCWSV